MGGGGLTSVRGVARIFQRGGHTGSNNNYCHGIFALEYCRLLKGLQGGAWAPQDPPSYALECGGGGTEGTLAWDYCTPQEKFETMLMNHFRRQMEWIIRGTQQWFSHK